MQNIQVSAVKLLRRKLRTTRIIRKKVNKWARDHRSRKDGVRRRKTMQNDQNGVVNIVPQNDKNSKNQKKR